ncbi:trafficking protein particle complex subunit 13 isoform X1 [Cinnamomum micranthum f. kanehirae]|uniref:Trafficking protein particle complex subunit 13 isoform X1 n=1 Tax=Cinnamomum micranthum f. kanehirae TaxID=337451 RepID=A0A443NCU9_9MAGN|nr:trafficking protein particle complex subunit 13 isoform X1 [Cinnamomum micranthum f. kanehirae]
MSSSAGSHSLAFRVMRLCRPSFHVETPLRLDPLDLIAGEDLFDDPHALLSSHDFISKSKISKEQGEEGPTDLSYRNRFELQNPYDAMGLSGLLVLPQAFGAIYLGETFCSYISINNSSNFEARDIAIKAEIQTEKQRILLLDTSKSPVESIRSGGRYDFIVEHDVKELGPHTLVCTALYNDGDGERKYLPQFFKFVVANPLSVRTKVRSIKENTYLEACIENHTKSNLFMDQVDFEPALHWTAAILKADDHHSETDFQTREIFNSPVLIKAGGGIHNFLYQLKLSSQESAEMKSNVLGKLQITWRTNLGEPGRLQTQQILGSIADVVKVTFFSSNISLRMLSSNSNRTEFFYLQPISQKEIDLRVVEVPSVIILQRPFLVNLTLSNQTDRKLGPFEVYLSQGDSHEEKVVVINGLQTLVLPQVEAFSSTDFNMNLIATRLGVQKISGITVLDVSENRIHDPLPDMEVGLVVMGIYTNPNSRERDREEGMLDR